MIVHTYIPIIDCNCAVFQYSTALLDHTPPPHSLRGGVSDRGTVPGSVSGEGQ